MSQRHPIVAVTGSSGAGTSTVKTALEHIFTRLGVKAAVIEGDSFHRYDRKEMRKQLKAAKKENRNLSHFGPEGNLFDKQLELFRSYGELLTEFNFGLYLWTSFYVSVLTVLITLLFSVPGAYAVARLRFAGRAAFSRSILLIYMVPMIVLALPIYIAFSTTGLRNTILGIAEAGAWRWSRSSQTWSNVMSHWRSRRNCT